MSFLSSICWRLYSHYVGAFLCQQSTYVMLHCVLFERYKYPQGKRVDPQDYEYTDHIFIRYNILLPLQREILREINILKNARCLI